MKKIYAFILGLLMMSGVARAENPAIDFVNTLADDIINQVLTADVSREEKLDRFREKFTQSIKSSQSLFYPNDFVGIICSKRFYQNQRG